MKFIGGTGQWVPGVPARDLTADEAERYPRASRSPLYEPKGGKRTLRKPRALRRGARNGAEYFLNCLRKRKPVEGYCNAQVSRDAQEILEAGLRSSNKGRAIDLPMTKR